MASWILIPCLDRLRDDFNAIAPSRDHASDGSIGDPAHAQEVSDHNPDETGSVPIRDADKVNEVHAIDVDDDLRESDLTMEKAVQFLLGRCRSGAEKRLRYIIYNRRIWSASSGWVQKAYTGPSPHTEHAHFSASYDSKLEASTASWHLEEIPVALTSTDRDWIRAEIANQLKGIIDDIWAYKVDVDVTSTGQNMQPTGGVLRYTSSEQKAIQATATAVKDAVEELQKSVGEIKAAIVKTPPPA